MQPSPDTEEPRAGVSCLIYGLAFWLCPGRAGQSHCGGGKNRNRRRMSNPELVLLVVWPWGGGRAATSQRPLRATAAVTGSTLADFHHNLCGFLVPETDSVLLLVG